MLSVILLSIGLISANLPYINTVNVIDNQKDGKYKHMLLKCYLNSNTHLLIGENVCPLIEFVKYVCVCVCPSNVVSQFHLLIYSSSICLEKCI